MVKACSKALLFSAIHLFCVIIHTSSSQSHLRPNANQSAIRGYEKLKASILPSITKQLTNFHHVRKQRQTETGKLYKDDSDVWILQGFQNRRGCPKAAHQFKVFQSIAGEWYAVIATNAVENNTEIYQFSAEHGCGRLVETLPTNMTFDFEIVRAHNVNLIVVLEKSPAAFPYKQTGSSVFVLTFETNLNVTASRRLVLGSEQPSCITSWEQFGVPYIAICNNKSREFRGTQSYRTLSYIYCAKGGYFDQCGEIETHFPQTIQHFQIFSRHYLAVANFPNVTVGEHVRTEILRYDVGTDKYKHLQFLPTKGAKDACFLKIGSGLDADHFLVIVNQLSFDSIGAARFDPIAHIYKFVGEKWEPFQIITLRSEKAAACVAYQTDGGRSAIMFALSWGAEIYQYNGWNFVSTVTYSKFAMGPGMNNLGSVRMNQETYITVANSNPQQADSDNLFLPKFSIWNGTLSGVYGRGMSSCEQMKNDLRFDPIQLVVGLYPRAVKKNDTVINLGKVDFKQLSTKRVWTTEVSLQSNKSRLGATQFLQLQSISSKLDGLRHRFNVSTDRKEHAMRTNGNYTINGRVRVKSLVSTCRGNGCSIENVTADNINLINIVEAYQQSIMMNDTFIPSLNVRRLIVKNSINTTTLSNRPVKDYIQINENNNFNGTFRLNGNLLINGQINVRGSVNHVTISPNSLLLRRGNQYLNWTLKSSNIRMKKLETRFLNNKDIGHLYQHAISNSSNFTLFQPKFFSSLTVSNLSLEGRVNKVNLTDLARNSMKITGGQIVTGIHGYKSAHLGRVGLSGLLNGAQFPKDFISVRENDTLNLGRLHLFQDGVFAHIFVKERVAGMNVSDSGRWGNNLLNKSSNQLQVILGKKKIETLKTSKDITSKSLNKRPIDVFQSNGRLYGLPDELLVYDSVTVQGDVRFEMPLSVMKENVGLQLLEEKGVPISTEVFPPITSLTLTRNVKVSGDLSTNALNGVSSSTFFTRDKKTPLVFTGQKTFNKTVFMNHTFTLFYTLNGYNLRDMWNKALKIEGNQTIPGTLLIQNNVDIVRLKARNSQLVPLAGPGLLTGKKHFQSLSIKGNWFVDVLNVTGLINDVNVSSWPSDTVLKNTKNQLITSQKSILSLTVKNAKVTSTDDVDIKHLLDVVLGNQPVIIYSDLMINGMFFGKRIIVNGSIDEVHPDAPLTWLRTGVNQNLNGSIEVQGSLKIVNFQQESWLINKINVKDILKRAVRLNESRQLSSLDFKHIVVDVFELGGLIQGHNLTEDLVLKHSNQQHRTITGVKSFTGPLISESLHVANKLNGLNPGKVCEIPVPEQTSKWIVSGNVLVKRNSKISASSINNEKLNETTRNLWLNDGNSRVMLKQNFSTVTINGTFSKEEVSNVSLSDLSRRSVKLRPNAEQRVTASHLFTIIRSNHLTAAMLNSSLINDLSIGRITNLVLLRDTEQNISNPVIFENVVASNVSIKGMLNGVNVSTSMMRNDRNRVITGKKSVYNLKVIEAIETCDTCLVGTVDISSWASGSVLRKGNFTLAGAQFESLSLQSLNLSGYLNGVNVSRDGLLTLSDRQEINGRLFISSLLPANILYSSDKGPIYHRTTEEFSLAARFENLQVRDFYDGIDLQRFYNQAVRRDLNVVFSEPVALSSLIAESFDDFSVNSTIRDIIELPLNEPHHVAPSGAFAPLISTEIDHMSNMVTEIGRVISHQSVEIKFFEEMTVTQQLPRVVDALFAWESRSGEVELCSFVNEHGELYYDSSLSPLLKEVEVTGVSSLKVSDDFAVATLDRSRNNKHHSFIFSRKLPSKIENQTIPTNYPIDTAAFLLSNKSCYLFLEMSSKSPIYCRPLGSNNPYSLAQNLSTIDARMVAVAQRRDNGLPMLIIASVGQRGYGHLTVWAFNATLYRFMQWKSIDTLQIIAMDCICNDGGCLLATVAPSKPAAIPGQIIIWSLKEDGPPTRLQRIAFLEPADVKLAQDPNGRVTLIVLQRSGVDNVFVYVWRGLQQFKYETTVRVPGAQDLQLIANDTKLLLALTVALPVTEVPYGPVRMFRANFFGRLN